MFWTVSSSECLIEVMEDLIITKIISLTSYFITNEFKCQTLVEQVILSLNNWFCFTQKPLKKGMGGELALSILVTRKPEAGMMKKFHR